MVRLDVTQSQGPRGRHAAEELRATPPAALSISLVCAALPRYVLGKGDGYRVVSYIGDTQQGPYEGAFVFTPSKDALSSADGGRLRGLQTPPGLEDFAKAILKAAEAPSALSASGLDTELVSSAEEDAAAAEVQATEQARKAILRPRLGVNKYPGCCNKRTTDNSGRPDTAKLKG